jgi:hypothetical protein
MFKYRSQAEIEKMTVEEAESYAVAKREFENDATKDQIEKAVESLKNEQKEAQGKIVKQLNELQENYNKLLEKADGRSQAEKGTFVAFVEKNIENFTETDKHYGASMVIKVAALMTTTNVTPNVDGGFSPLFGNYIDTEIGHTPKPENIILPLVTVKTQPGTENIWTSDRVNEDGDAQFIAEGGLKPLADADWSTTKHPIKEVAVRWKFTKRLMMHAPAVVQDFQEHAIELVEQKIDDQLLEGTGLTVNLSGLQTLASAFIVPTGLAGYYQAPNIYDVVMAMATRIRLSNFRGQITAVLNTVWMAKMAGIKDAENRYIVAPFVSPDGTRVGAVNIVFSNKIGDGTILIGDLKKFNVVFAENIMYDEGYENDDFSKNLVSRKLEAFLGTYIKASDAGSILLGDISDIQDDLVV